MAMIYIDGMDLYGSDASMQAAGWILDSPANIQQVTSGGRFGGGAVYVEQAFILRRPVVISGSTLILQFAFKHTSLATATNRDMIIFYNNGGASKCGTIEVAINGSLRVKDSSDTLQATSIAGVVKEGVWQYMEAKIVIGDTGSITIKVNNTQVINATSIDTKPGTATDVDMIGFSGASSTYDDLYYDDIIIMDGSGSLNNDFIGDHVIKTLLPDSDDATDAAWLSQPSQSVGSEYLNIDDTAPGSDDGDSTYNYSNTPADDSLYGFENLSVTPASISAVQLTLSAKKTDGGSRTVKHLFKGDTKIAETAFNPGTDYELHRKIREQSADSTPVAWTAAKVNALLAGMRLES